MQKILILGNSTIQKRIRIEEIIEKFPNAEIVTLSPENYVDEEINNIFTMGSIFSKDRIIVISDFDSFKILYQEKISTLLKHYDNAVKGILILDSQKENKYLKEINFDRKIEAMIPPLWKDELWIEMVKDLASKLHKQLSNETAEKIIQFVGKNEDLLYEEIKKLSIYSNMEIISIKDVEDVSTYFSTASYEELCYDLVTKKLSNSLIKLHSIVKSSSFSPIALANYLYKYFLDLYSVILNSERKANYNWSEVMKISKDSMVSLQRVASFLGFNFKTDKVKKINVEKLYSPTSIEKIIIDIEELDRSLKTGGEPKVLFPKLFEEICSA
ncbi:MAG: DNA polymerase III delta [Petrotoga mobilis]|nr:MAG: DNA polymerase III delta [Petrotoga mobilis]